MQDLVSRDGEQKDEKPRAKLQRGPVEKKNGKELAAGVLVGEAETSGGQASPKPGPPVCEASHA